jgi:hypothetical protein
VGSSPSNRATATTTTTTTTTTATTTATSAATTTTTTATTTSKTTSTATASYSQVRAMCVASSPFVSEDSFLILFMSNSPNRKTVFTHSLGW